MRVLQRGREPDLAGKTLHAQPFDQIRSEDLDHHLARQRFFARDKHAGHAAPTKLRLQRERCTERFLQAVTQRIGHRNAGRKEASVKVAKCTVPAQLHVAPAESTSRHAP